MARQRPGPGGLARAERAADARPGQPLGAEPDHAPGGDLHLNLQHHPAEVQPHVRGRLPGLAVPGGQSAEAHYQAMLPVARTVLSSPIARWRA